LELNALKLGAMKGSMQISPSPEAMALGYSPEARCCCQQFSRSRHISDARIRALCIHLAHINTFPSVGRTDEQASHREISLKKLVGSISA
jgi:hypothetical protein